jgi:hypothetical protein
LTSTFYCAIILCAGFFGVTVLAVDVVSYDNIGDIPAYRKLAVSAAS